MLQAACPQGRILFKRYPAHQITRVSFQRLETVVYVSIREHTSCFFPYTLDPPDMAVPGRVPGDVGMSAVRREEGRGTSTGPIYVVMPLAVRQEKVGNFEGASQQNRCVFNSDFCSVCCRRWSSLASDGARARMPCPFWPIRSFLAHTVLSDDDEPSLYEYAYGTRIYTRTRSLVLHRNRRLDFY